MASLYTGDDTEINVNGELMGNTEVRNGIRQGCTGSPQLFLMVINVIIKRIMETGLGFQNEKISPICAAAAQVWKKYSYLHD